jgi:cell division septation protein DedD
LLLIIPLPEITFKVTRQSGNYHIVAGAFRVEENAHQTVSELKAEGLRPVILVRTGMDLHQVVYSSFQTRGEALQMLLEVKRTNEGAWLLIQEL